MTNKVSRLKRKTTMTTKLHKAFNKGKNSYYFFKCDCGNIFTARNDKSPKSCGCLLGKPKSYDFNTNTIETIIIPKTEKCCYICKQTLSIDLFHNGYSKCKDCAKNYKKNYRQIARDKIAEYQKQYRLNNLGLTEQQHNQLKEQRHKRAELNKQIAQNRKMQHELRKQQLINADTKVCIKCKEEKLKSEFYKNSKKIDGYDCRCKECEKLRLREERGYTLTKSKTEEEKRIRKKLQKHKRRFIEQQGKIRPKEVRELYLKQGAKCYWCGDDISKQYHIDHYEPLSKGGEHTIENIVLSCPTCNMKKSNKSPYEYANSIGRLL